MMRRRSGEPKLPLPVLPVLLLLLPPVVLLLSRWQQFRR